VALVFQDITQRKQAEIALQSVNSGLEQRVSERTAELTAINDRMLVVLKEQAQTESALQQQTMQERLRWNITQAIRQSLDLKAILNAAVAEVRQTLQADRVAVYRFQPDWSGDFIAESVSPGWVKLVEPEIPKVCEDTHLQDTQGGRFQRHETFVISDIYAAGLHSCHIALLEQFQAKAYAVAPIFSGTALWGLLAIYQNATSRQWKDWEIELLQQIASQLAIAIQQSELYGQLQVELKERQQATAVIREAERRWRSLLDNVQLIVVGLDLLGNINYVNPFFLSLTGYTDTEVIGKNWLENFLPPSSQPSIQTDFAEILNQYSQPYHQSAILTRAGEERLIAWNNTTLQDSNNSVIGTISIGEDITERQKVEKMKNEFISIVSHELRTPLTSIRGSLGLLATGVMDDEPAAMKRMIDIAATDTERLVRLVNDVLDLEKLESGKISLIRTWCNAADLMQRSLEIMHNSAQEANVQIIVQPLSLQIWVDADRIIQTLTNLLSNAIKFSPPAGTIWLNACLVDGEEDEPKGRNREGQEGQEGQTSSPAPRSLPPTPSILFSVKDQGRGIPADKLESIFGRFQQVDASDSRDQGGTGLGLAICKSIVQQHEGHIWVESCWGQGSTFFFSLPLPT
ncbi:MAG: ATP-binding protein, partial [Kovacikia sp.]